MFSPVQHPIDPLYYFEQQLTWHDAIGKIQLILAGFQTGEIYSVISVSILTGPFQFSEGDDVQPSSAFNRPLVLFWAAIDLIRCNWENTVNFSRVLDRGDLFRDFSQYLNWGIPVFRRWRGSAQFSIQSTSCIILSSNWPDTMQLGK